MPTRPQSRRPAPVGQRPQVEILEDRLVPSATAPDVNLSTHGSSGQINGAPFRQLDAQPTGSGVIDSFVRIQSKSGPEQGFNTDARPLQFDENKSPTFTHSLKLSDVPQVNIGGTMYKEFLLDINQQASQPRLSLDQLKLYVGSKGDLKANNLAGMNPVYDLDAHGDHWLALNGRLNQGSGKGDMIMCVPSSVFAGAEGGFLYLFSRFGDQQGHGANGGFEEWAVASSPVTQATGSISGKVMTTNLVPMANVVVFFDADGDFTLDDDEVRTMTDAYGMYSFKGLAGGVTYTVRQVVPTGYFQVSADPLTINLAEGQDIHDVNFINGLIFDPSDPPNE